MITPELSVGYPPRDLIFRSKFIDDNLKVIEKIAEKVGNVPIVVGCIDYNTQNTGNPFENAAVVIKDHEIVVRQNAYCRVMMFLMKRGILSHQKKYRSKCYQV